MVAYNFQARFADAVERGEKRQTIRLVGKRRHARPGERVQLYTGMRTKSCRLLGEATATHVAPVRIEATHMKMDGHRLPGTLWHRDQAEQTDNEFAEADGFACFADMADWFHTTHGLPFEGVVIFWSEPHGGGPHK